MTFRYFKNFNQNHILKYILKVRRKAIIKIARPPKEVEESWRWDGLSLALTQEESSNRCRESKTDESSPKFFRIQSFWEPEELFKIDTSDRIASPETKSNPRLAIVFWMSLLLDGWLDADKNGLTLEPEPLNT